MERVRKVLVELYGHANERVMEAVRELLEDASSIDSNVCEGCHKFDDIGESGWHYTEDGVWLCPVCWDAVQKDEATIRGITGKDALNDTLGECHCRCGKLISEHADDECRDVT